MQVWFVDVHRTVARDCWVFITRCGIGLWYHAYYDELFEK